MCGIAGFASSRGAHPGRDTITSMTSRLSHRGPDDCGTWLDPSGVVAFGHRRLAVIDVSDAGRQPMRSPSGRFTIVLNGEIYNYRDIRLQLESSGALASQWRGSSDTEVVIAAIEAWGMTRAVQSFVGMFAFAVWDAVESTLYLVRDRLGEKPLYYSFRESTLLFASELKALAVHPMFRCEIDQTAVEMFLRFGYIPAPLSIYRDVKKLTPGTILTVRLNGADSPAVDVTPYWQLASVVKRSVRARRDVEVDEACDQLDTLLRGVVSAQMVSDVPLGAFLSGGIDSSTIVALMQAESSRPVKTFTIGFHEGGYNEAQCAALVARHLGTDHTELYVTPDHAMEVIPMLAELYDEPFADSSQLPTVLVARLARRHVTVSLSGDGGDELFGGYNRHIVAAGAWRYLQRVPRSIRSVVARGLTQLTPAEWDRLYRAMESVLPTRMHARAVGDKLHKVADVLASRGPEELYGRLVCSSSIADGHASPMLAGDNNFAAVPPAGVPLSDAEWMMYMDTLTYLPDDILVKLDRATMSVGLEGRVPFLDHRVVEYAWQLPERMKIRHGTGKVILRRLLGRYLPEQLYERPKAGFGVPIGAWLRGPLRGWAEDLLSEGRLTECGIFDVVAVRRRWSSHLSGATNEQHRIWNVLMFQAWLRNNPDATW